MDNLCRNMLAPLLLRLGLAFFFAFQGLSKLGPNNDWGGSWDDRLPSIAQLAIAWGELLGAAAVAVGFVTRAAAVVLAGILAASVMGVHGGAGFDVRVQGLAFEYTVALLVACLTLALLGSGVLGLDTWLWRKKR
jgi:putative oxidoreductase